MANKMRAIHPGEILKGELEELKKGDATLYGEKGSVPFFLEKIGIGKYSGEMAEWLVAHGHKVRVVTAPHYYPQWRVAGPNRWR